MAIVHGKIRNTGKRLNRRGGVLIAIGKYKEWLDQDKLTLLQGWARDGLSDEQLAHNIGINTCTLYDWKNKYPEIAKALKKGKEIIDYYVENALLKKALSGDTVAMIFWLKNRKPAQWRDRPAAVESTDIEDMKPLADLLGEPIE